MFGMMVWTGPGLEVLRVALKYGGRMCDPEECRRCSKSGFYEQIFHWVSWPRLPVSISSPCCGGYKVDVLPSYGAHLEVPGFAARTGELWSQSIRLVPFCFSS